MTEDVLVNNKKSFLETCLLKHRELGKRQREYKKIASSKLQTRKETIIEASYEHAINQLLEEKNELRAQIWVANGHTHKLINERHLSQIHCHVQCQESLASDLRRLKVSVLNMEREISRLDKQIYDLNLQTVPDTQHQQHVARMRKKLMILENALEVGVRQECGFTAINAALREELIHTLKHRTFFNQLYTKMVQKLNSDKKYLIDLVEYALNTFDNCVDVYEKIDIIVKRETKEQELRKVEMQGIMRKMAADYDNTEFLDTKCKTRTLADLQPKEYRRRDEFRRKHNKKINLYNSVLEKILNYTNTKSFKAVIEAFQQQESLYYSFFNYANEMSYHITLINNAVNNLFGDITSLKVKNMNTLEKQLENIKKLEGEYQEKEQSNSDLVKLRENNTTNIESLLQGVEVLCEMSGTDSSPLKDLLGDHTHVNILNFHRFLKFLEYRVQAITACVYVQDRAEEQLRNYTVQNIEKFCETQTPLNHIVLTQQCPECAEGEAFNMDEGGDGVTINTVEEARRKLYEKITQPEMQYRLHSISQCRLPRSRLLAAKRFI